MSPEVKGILVAGLALCAIFTLVFTTMDVGNPGPEDPCTPAAASSSVPVQTEVPTPSLRELAEAQAREEPLPARAPKIAARNVLVAHANLFGRMSADRFRHDLARVVSGGPDFVTLNETYFRSQGELEPEGYDAWRSESPFDARETPVLWRADRWKLRDHGTLLMHAQRGKWGIRYVNWVTLVAKKGGQVASVISVHTSPPGGNRGALLGQYLDRLDELVTALRPRGPVIIGGDFNANYLSSGPRSFLIDRFAGMEATPTVVTLGEPAGGYRTDHGGGALDYIVLSGAKAISQGVSPLTYSDHKMVRALVQLPAKKLPVPARAVPPRKKPARVVSTPPVAVPATTPTAVPVAAAAAPGCGRSGS